MDDCFPAWDGHAQEAQLGGRLSAGVIATLYCDDTWAEKAISE